MVGGGKYTLDSDAMVLCDSEKQHLRTYSGEWQTRSNVSVAGKYSKAWGKIPN